MFASKIIPIRKRISILFSKKHYETANKIIIICPCRKNKTKENGDYQFGKAICKYLEKKGYTTELRCIEDWYTKSDGKYVLVLRGSIKYNPDKNKVNIMWNISHPTEVSVDEYNEYDLIFIASKKYAEIIKPKINKSIYVLEQCTDPELFKRDVSVKNGKIIFVGYHHSEGRKSVSDLLPTEYDFELYGPKWKGFIDEKYYKGEVIENDKLADYYNKYSIVLNDHRPDMANNGFLSNRIYDVYAAGGFVISHYFEGMDDIIDGLVYYKDRNELNELIDYYLSHTDSMIENTKKIQKIVLSEHTFEKRVDVIIEKMSNLKLNK